MAEPRDNIQFNDTGGGNTSTNYTLPNSPFEPIQIPIIPTQIPTNNTNVTAVSQPPTNIQPAEQTTRQVENPEGELEPVRISTLTTNGVITLYGRYPQNSVDIERFDLSSINVVSHPEIDFKFILCIKDGKDSIPELYVTKKVYIELTKKYAQNDPIPVNQLINPSKIVMVDIEPIKNKVEDLRVSELALDINLTNVGENDYVQVFRNLFVNSNYETTQTNELRANPTYSIIELLKYISWVVAKPAQSYNDRILPASNLGEWKSKLVEETPSEDEPSTPINAEVDNNNNPAPPPPPIYPPIGRAGRYDGEEVFKDSVLWNWNEDDMKWEFFGAAGSGNQNFGGFN